MPLYGSTDSTLHVDPLPQQASDDVGRAALSRTPASHGHGHGGRGRGHGGGGPSWGTRLRVMLMPLSAPFRSLYAAATLMGAGAKAREYDRTLPLSPAERLAQKRAQRKVLIKFVLACFFVLLVLARGRWLIGGGGSGGEPIGLASAPRIVFDLDSMHLKHYARAVDSLNDPTLHEACAEVQTYVLNGGVTPAHPVPNTGTSSSARTPTILIEQAVRALRTLMQRAEYIDLRFFALKMFNGTRANPCIALYHHSDGSIRTMLNPRLVRPKGYRDLAEALRSDPHGPYRLTTAVVESLIVEDARGMRRERPYTQHARYVVALADGGFGEETLTLTRDDVHAFSENLDLLYARPYVHPLEAAGLTVAADASSSSSATAAAAEE
jgi:hypothetical protein